MDSCKTCRFWKSDYQDDNDRYAMGSCRHSHPTANGFGRVNASQWCGEFEPIGCDKRSFEESYLAIRAAGGDAWDGLDVSKELAEMRGCCGPSDEPEVIIVSAGTNDINGCVPTDMPITDDDTDKPWLWMPKDEVKTNGSV